MVKKSNGIYYGYPNCCIKEFHQILLEEDPIIKEELKERKKLNYLVSNNSGFIPCDYHTTKIINNEIKLEDIIQNRICKSKFPKSN